MIMKKHTGVGVRLLYVFMILHINIRNLIFVDNKMRSLWSFCQSFIQSSRTVRMTMRRLLGDVAGPLYTGYGSCSFIIERRCIILFMGCFKSHSYISCHSHFMRICEYHPRILFHFFGSFLYHIFYRVCSVGNYNLHFIANKLAIGNSS